MQEQIFHEIELEQWSQHAADYDVLFGTVSAQVILPILESLGELAGKHHLDVACGTGHLVAAMSKRGVLSKGSDFAGPMIHMARCNYPEEQFEVADAIDLPFADSSFDAVTCAFGLSHIARPQTAVAEVFRMLKPGGRFAFTLWFGPDDGGEFLAIVKEAIDAHATTEVALPPAWTQWRYANMATCQRMVESAGFMAPVFKTIPVVWEGAEASELLALIDRLSVRTRLVISNQPHAVRRRIYTQILSESEAHRSGKTIRLAWPALLTVVQKPGEGC